MSTAPSDPHLASFPRPADDNGRAVHFTLDMNEDNVRNYLPLMKDFQMRWTVVYGGNEQVVCRAAKILRDEAGVMSVLRIEAREDRPIPPPSWDGYVKFALREGITPYFQLYNEPEIEFSTPERFAELWGPRAEVMAGSGAYVGLQTMSEEFFAAAAARMSEDVKKRLFFVPHNYSLNHPPDYPYNIGKTIFDDDSALLRFIECARWCTKYLGFIPPMICGEGGVLYAHQEDERFPPAYGKQWVDWHREMYEWMRTGVLSNGDPLPDYLFCVTSWILGPEAGWYSDAWVNGLQSDTNNVNERDTTGVFKSELLEWLKSSAPYVRQFGAQAQPPLTEHTEPSASQGDGSSHPTIAVPTDEQPLAGNGAAETYTVQGGDTLSAIARNHGVTVAALIAANHIENPNLIRPGQVLTIPPH